VKNFKYSHRLIFSVIAVITMLSMAFGANYLQTKSASAAGFSTIPGSAARWIKGAHLVSHHKSSDQLTIGLMLRTAHPDQQRSLLASLYHQNSPSYHHWLATGEFDQLFGPTASDVAAAKSFLASAGLHLVASPDATMLLATGTASQVEATFHITLNDYSLANGQQYFGNDSDVEVPTSLSNAVLGVFGLSNFATMKPHAMMDEKAKAAMGPPPYGGGPFGSGLTPSQTAGIYDATPVFKKLHDSGQGVSLAVFELAGYTASDIAHYENHYGLNHVPLVNKLVLGGATSHNGAAEVELDIELQIAMAQGVNQLLVYQSPNTELGVLAQYLQIAKDNQADAISTSWGVPCEFGVTSQLTLGENQFFTQMAAQGQSLFAASGDAGAFGCTRVGLSLPFPESLQLGDPNDQPYNTAVGGTSFQGPDNVTTFDPGKNPHPTYPGTSAELTWIDTPCDSTQCPGGGSGGGVSRLWGSPDYVVDPATGNFLPGVIESSSQSGSYCGQQPGVLCRENPDVSLDADPSTGYSIYCTDPGDAFCAVGEFTPKPGWIRLGGTSTAAPLWAGIAALDDAHHHARLGLFNYFLYPLDSPAGYASQFHDITKFDNGFYPAGPTYDMATGIGTPDIFNLINT
jgi:subtilase family serine protease